MRDMSALSLGSVSVSALSNHELLAETARVVSVERTATAQLIALLAEVDRRELYLAEGYSSMFVYCTQVLHLSEGAAYDRIEAARASQWHPSVLQRLMDGAVTLTAVRLLAPHVTTDNCDALLEAARHKSKREILHLVACIAPQPDVASSVRRLPVARSVETTSSALPLCSDAQPDEPAAAFATAGLLRGPVSAQRPRAVVAPLAPERYLIKVTISREAHEQLRRAQDLLRHALPTGDPAAIVERALAVLVDQLERRRLAKSVAPRSTVRAVANSRRVPASIRRLVWDRDAGQCAFVGAHGRCPETGFLEFHHVVPYAAGGQTSVENLALRCRAHNAYEGVKHFGATRAGTSSGRSAPRRTDQCNCTIRTSASLDQRLRAVAPPLEGVAGETVLSLVGSPASGLDK